MSLKFQLESLDGVDDAIAPYYQETENGFQLQLDGGPQDLSGDVTRLKGALEKERSAHKETKSKYAGLDGITPDEVQGFRDQIEDLEFKLGEKKDLDEGAIEERAERLAERKLRKSQAQIEQLTAENAAHLNAIQLHEAAGNQRRIKDAVDAALTGEKAPPIVDTAREDIIPFAERIMGVDEEGNVVTRDGVGFEPGLTFAEVLDDIRDSGRRKHWFKGNTSGNANGDNGGSGFNGSNPFKAETKNLTEATKLIKADPKRARQLIISAGEKPSKYGLN